MSPVYGTDHEVFLANDYPSTSTTTIATSTSTSSMINATLENTLAVTNAASTSTSASSSYSTASVATSASASSSMSSYTTSTSNVTSVTSSYVLVTTATIPTVQAVTPDFALFVSTPVAYLPPGDFVGTTSFTLTVAGIGGWSGLLRFATSSLPPGIAVFNVPWRYWLNSGIVSWYVQVAIGPSVWSGSYPLVVTASSGSIVHSAVVSIIVQSPVVFPQFFSLVATLIFPVAFTNRRHS